MEQLELHMIQTVLPSDCATIEKWRCWSCVIIFCSLICADCLSIVINIVIYHHGMVFLYYQYHDNFASSLITELLVTRLMLKTWIESFLFLFFNFCFKYTGSGICVCILGHFIKTQLCNKHSSPLQRQRISGDWMGFVSNQGNFSAGIKPWQINYTSNRAAQWRASLV